MTDGQSMRLSFFVECLLEFMARNLSVYRALLSVGLGGLLSDNGAGLFVFVSIYLWEPHTEGTNCDKRQYY
jgi:hypothetical protein